MTISIEVLDELLMGVERPEDLLGDTGLFHIAIPPVRIGKMESQWSPQ